MMRRLLIETVRSDPDYQNGNYTAQPRAMKLANVFFAVGTNGGTLAYQKLAPTREKADKLIDDRLAAPFGPTPTTTSTPGIPRATTMLRPELERIEAALLAINSADDERNPPETGIMERELKRLKNGRLYLIPASEETRGHGTTGMAKFYARQLQEFLQSVPQRAM